MDAASAAAALPAAASEPLWWLLLAALGLVVGVIAGMFGVGGGFILTPLLVLLFKIPPGIAVGTGLCQMIGVSVAAQIRYTRLREGEAKLGWMMVAGGVLGVTAGTRVLSQLSRSGEVTLGVLNARPIPADELYLSLGYVLLLSGIAAWMSRDLRRPAPIGAPPAGPLTRVELPPMTVMPRTGRRLSAPLVGLIGLALGGLAGVLGVAGGVILTPLLVYGVGMRLRTAAATGVVLLLATSVVGTISHALEGRVHLGIAITLLIGSTFGAQVGALLTTRLEPKRLSFLFIGLVAMTGLAVAWNLARDLFFGP
ncbi:MAG TPA: sulfite exporter TauE/SafE family protein [Armatimonadaceae bacterium]|nr:sulfite exporter TauE/SafE family protein [Armatimonadaceae bacterium]